MHQQLESVEERSRKDKILAINQWILFASGFYMIIFSCTEMSTCDITIFRLSWRLVHVIVNFIFTVQNYIKVLSRFGNTDPNVLSLQIETFFPMNMFNIILINSLMSRSKVNDRQSSRSFKIVRIIKMITKTYYMYFSLYLIYE